eukprot:GDKI01021308.1.p1 GENE.GDKI01021308.1~~GDKI01021308.1.p1  ORF type:complete len:278 (+),score=75.95 GDKI01021308.1:110-943(+)
MNRPEHLAPPEIFYNKDEAEKYAQNSRMIDIQSTMSERCIELLMLPKDSNCLVLDIGCGSGISGGVLSEQGHFWVGLDISESMLDVALDREVEGDVMLNDMGQGFSFRAGTFDGAISVSALQWLCNVDKKGHEPFKRLLTFFKALYASLQKGARAALQFYPETPEQVEMITAAAMRSGFGGGLVVDYPNSTKAKKHFLCLYAGFTSAPPQMPKALNGEPETAEVAGRQRERKKGPRRPVKNLDWILQKKERQRLQGKDVRPDSKYTGRKREGKLCKF